MLFSLETEELKLGTEQSQGAESDLHKKVEEKRLKGRIRSKETRKRRKEYIVQLEEKVKKLESENFRLQNLLMNYRTENFERIDDGQKSIMDKIQEHRNSLAQTVMDNSGTDITPYNIDEFTERFDKESNLIHQKFK